MPFRPAELYATFSLQLLAFSLSFRLRRQNVPPSLASGCCVFNTPSVPLHQGATHSVRPQHFLGEMPRRRPVVIPFAFGLQPFFRDTRCTSSALQVDLKQACSLNHYC